MITWKNKIELEMKMHEDSWANIQSCTLLENELNQEFDDGFGGENGLPFTVWTNKRVYFPICYDGAEWCGSVSRHPDGKATAHQGGG
jgi:hypothetical protein